jgi:phosphoribosylamine-glycine ligase
MLGVTAVGGNLDEAQSRVYAGLGQIAWPSMCFRKDIGLRGKV